MDQERHKRISELFARTIELAPDEQEAFLLSECGGDQELIEELKSLLSHDKEESILGSTEHLVPQDLAPGERVGSYRILDKLGEGGMGAVYLAEQEEPIRRRVALKIIKLGMDTKEVVARFEVERQALAMMDHPNIAKVLDAGATERGRPYFVMEHVPGIPITAYCDKHRLTTKERLELYIPVCQAIHHAHQKAIIHRDVKPSNVLIMVQDGKPIPKVIDFGVAKAINQRLTEKTMFTEQGRLIGTPVYMSPEQAEMTGLSVDTTTDVYSLGVMLYELLVGAPPFNPHTLRMAGLEAIYRIIREEEPLKPSTRISSLGDDAARVAVVRRTEPARLERQVRGELDWVIMRAMEKDRTRRYPSASEFSADIERYLFGEPVAAGPPTTAYKLRKFMARHRAGVGVVVAGAVILLGFAATMTVQAQRIARERNIARLEAERGRLESEALQPVLKDFYSRTNKDESVSEYWGQLQNATEMHRKLSGDHTELAMFLANRLAVLNWLYLETENEEYLDLRKLSEPETFGAIHRALSEEDSTLLQTIDMLMNVYDPERELDALIRWVNLDADPRQLEMAALLSRDALTLRRKIRIPGAPDLTENMMDLSTHLRALAGKELAESRTSEAEVHAREAMELLVEAGETGGAWTWWQMREVEGLLGEALSRQGRYEEAEPHLIESLKNERREDLLRIIDLYDSWGKVDRADHYRGLQCVESIRELGRVGTGSHGQSASLGGRSIWLLEDPLGPCGWKSNSWAWTEDRNAGDGLELRDPGTMVTKAKLVPYTAEERVFNERQRESGSLRQWALRPRDIVEDGENGRALVAYTKGLSRVGTWEYDCRGMSLGTLEDGGTSVVRRIVRPESEYPTLLFQGEEEIECVGMVVGGDHLYLYWGEAVPVMDVDVKVARVSLVDVFDRRAWRFFAGFGDGGQTARWVDDWRAAVPIMKGEWTLSVDWNDHLGKYLCVYSRGEGIRIRTGEQPEGPWSEGLMVFKDWSVGNAVAHSEFSLDEGRRVYVSYTRDWSAIDEEIRLLELTFR
jgi:serine/threonine protein kinase